jgi:hypothetical protein
MNVANGSDATDATDDEAVDTVCATAGETTTAPKAAAIVIKRTALPTLGQRASVLATVQGGALKRRPDGRPGPPLRAPAARTSVGTEEWCGVRSNRGMTGWSQTGVMVTAPWESRAALPSR